MNEETIRQGISLVRAVMACASSDNIPRTEWWSRAKTALEVSATCAHDFGEMVSVMARKLQVDALVSKSSNTIHQLSVELEADFEAFRGTCANKALYIVALAQAERDLEKESKK